MPLKLTFERLAGDEEDDCLFPSRLLGNDLDDNND